VRKLLCLLCAIPLIACSTKPLPTATPYPTYTPWPTYTPYRPPTASPTALPTPTAVPVPLAHGWQQAQVVGVTDGDTIEVSISGQTYRLRYIGVDAPELDEPCYEEAKRFNSYLVNQSSSTVYLEKDSSNVDAYDRLLRYVWVAAVDGYRMVNAELAEMGYAQAKAYPPDTKHQATLTQAEQRARQAGRVSCWVRTPTPTGTATPTPTASPRPGTATPLPATSTPVPVSGCPQGCTSPPPGCVIKGNISSSSGEKIYHVPGQRNYEQTVIDPAKGERWFCTEEEATANGWRKSKQ